MIINIILLFIAGFSGIIFLLKAEKISQDNFRLGIAFAGGFLLSISLLHILPDLFQSELGSFKVGLLVLGGFFLQQFLEYLTDGAEHGHFHKHQNGHQHKLSFGVLILIGLSIHSFLEGTILSIPANEMNLSGGGLLAGIVLHKIPASFALASVLLCCISTKPKIILLILLFALASPVGLISGVFINSANNGYLILMTLLAIVSGNFLHISTTIVFEGSPGHRFNFHRLLWSVLGAGLGIAGELLN